MLLLLFRYALDVKVERAEDVLTHQRLLKLAEDPATRPVFEVRSVQVIKSLSQILAYSDAESFVRKFFCFVVLNWFLWPSFLQVTPRISADSDPALEEDAQSSNPSGQGYSLLSN